MPCLCPIPSSTLSVCPPILRSTLSVCPPSPTPSCLSVPHAMPCLSCLLPIFGPRHALGLTHVPCARVTEISAGRRHGSGQESLSHSSWCRGWLWGWGHPTVPWEHPTLLGHTAGDTGEVRTAPGLLDFPRTTLRDARPCLLLLACLHDPLGSAPRQWVCMDPPTGWWSQPCTPGGAGGGGDLTAVVPEQMAAGGGMGEGSGVLLQGWGWRSKESSLTPYNGGIWGGRKLVLTLCNGGAGGGSMVERGSPDCCHGVMWGVMYLSLLWEVIGLTASPLGCSVGLTFPPT